MTLNLKCLLKRYILELSFQSITERSILMKLRNLFIVSAVVALVFAAGLLLAPKTMLTIFGLSVGATVRSNAVINLVAQLLGAALVVPGLLSWFAGGMQSEERRVGKEGRSRWSPY